MVGKFELLMFAVGGLALLSGTGAFRSRNRARRERMATGSPAYRTVHAGGGHSSNSESTGEVDEATDQGSLDGAAIGGAARRAACVEITDQLGMRLCTGNTPCSVRLPRVAVKSCGSSDFHVALHVLHDQLPHVGPQHLVLRSVPNGWYLHGQFIFGAHAGWIIFDPERGSLHHLDQAQLYSAGVGDPHTGDKKTNLSFVLIDDVPEQLRAVIRQVNCH